MPSDLLMDGQEDLIEVNVYYTVRRNAAGNRLFTILSKEDGEKAIEEEKENTDVLKTRWMPQTWQLNNNIMRESTMFNKISNSNEIDWTIYQNKMVQYCLKEWNMTTKEGTAVPPTLDNVGMLPPAIAGSMLRKYDETMKVDEEEKKE